MPLALPKPMDLLRTATAFGSGNGYVGIRRASASPRRRALARRMHRRGLLINLLHRQGRGLLLRVAQMLTKLVLRMQR